MKIKTIPFCSSYCNSHEKSIYLIYSLILLKSQIVSVSLISIQNKVQKKIIIITGGPGTGKTTLLNALRAKGFCCYPEISRAITLAAQKEGIEQLFLEKPLLFSELLLKGRKEQFENAQMENENLVFIDRGIPDILGYMDYIGDSYPDYFEKAGQETTYSHVFSLPPWKEIYETDEARYESFDQAQAIHQKIITAYAKLNYNPVEVPKDTIENRIAFLFESIQQEP